MQPGGQKRGRGPLGAESEFGGKGRGPLEPSGKSVEALWSPSGRPVMKANRETLEVVGQDADRQPLAVVGRATDQGTDHGVGCHGARMWSGTMLL